MKIRYLGHSAFQIDTGKHKLLIDPFLSGNPNSGATPDECDADYILVSHAHGDHLGDAVSISKRCGAIIISNFEIATYCNMLGAKSHPLHIGGSFGFDFGRVKLTIAHHGSTLVAEDGSFVTLGAPCGFLIFTGGKTLYHAGDTGLFYDMKLIGEMYSIDAAMLPIGDNFTMGIDDAVKAVQFLNPKVTIPMHYNTFDVIKADPNRFAEKVMAAGNEVAILGPGQSMEV